MVYRYRVSLAGLKGFARVYELKSSMTLYDFHLRLRDDLDFAHDQLIQFKALDNAGGLVARYGLFNLGAGAVDEVSLADTVEKGVASFIYFYDVASKKSVIITLEGEDPGTATARPALLESKGPVPEAFENGYVAFEDLPEEQRHLPGERPDDDDDDDEDFDDEEEDGSDDEEEVIYDANE